MPAAAKILQQLRAKWLCKPATYWRLPKYKWPRRHRKKRRYRNGYVIMHFKSNSKLFFHTVGAFLARAVCIQTQCVVSDGKTLGFGHGVLAFFNLRVVKFLYLAAV